MPEVAQYRIGNTTVRVMDDACAGKTEAEVQEILRRICRMACRVRRQPRGRFQSQDQEAKSSEHQP